MTEANSAGQSGVENLACSLPIIKEAEEGNRLLIIDTKTGFRLRDPMFEFFVIVVFTRHHQSWRSFPSSSIPRASFAPRWLARHSSQSAFHLSADSSGRTVFIPALPP